MLHDTIASLDRVLHRQVIRPGGYDSARREWNAMIDRHPALIVRCGAATDVPHAIRFARERDLEIAVRGGGHNIAGHAVCDGGLVIDVSALTRVDVDTRRCRATIAPGATLAQVDAATQQYGLATPLGINSTTGVAGLTLGGGFGWLTRRYGLTVDNLFCAGDHITGKEHLARLRRLGDPLGEHVGPQPYAAWQQAFDPLLAPGARNYWKSHNRTELADGMFARTIEAASRQPSDQCEIFIGLVAGVANLVRADAMVYPHRNARFVVNVHGRWDAPEQDAACRAWARQFYEAAAPFASGGAYVNVMTDDEGGRVANAGCGQNYPRLVDVKRTYDPDDVFHVNHNIKP